MNIVAITGSGISAPSGIKTYRDAGSGWDEYADGIAHAKQYGNHLPELWNHWTHFVRNVSKAVPNDAHTALTRHKAGIVTQNIDGLHDAAGSENILALHGDIHTTRCLRCYTSQPTPLSPDPICNKCGSDRVRPDIVLFGEKLSAKKVRAAERLVLNADVVLVVGTSGVVYPVRGMIDNALEMGKRTYLFDMKPWFDEDRFTDVILGNCADTLPKFLNALRLNSP